MATYRVIAPSLNFRKEPSKDGALIAQLPLNTSGESLGSSSDAKWIKLRIEFSDGVKTGWAAARFLESVTAEPPWMARARSEIGVREFPGPQHNPRIVEYHRVTSLQATADEVAWCSSFVNWCFDQVGIAGTRSAAAISWTTWPGAKRLTQPQYGCITVLKRVDPNNRNAAHVAFFVRQTGPRLELLGGNQSNQVKISTYLASDLIGYYWPKNL